eukprot:TRINITY_DN4470_c0_g1_i1.p1 TRINITY_DN4470_c0_g1~~TRINITY_DN4470_c0_g1_i1.p1  ORF type:complete len:653 (-),score=88.85 TRINITY_DN4470_c0_g1_i1:95-2053(-)
MNLNALSTFTSNTLRIRIVSGLLGLASLLLFLVEFDSDFRICLSAHSVLSKGQIFRSFIAPLVDSNVFLILLNTTILSLFENSLHKIFPSTQTSSSTSRFFGILCILYSLFIIARLTFGYIFFYGTGWSNPKFFFSTSWHECSMGLFPVLFEFLILESLFTTDRYYFSGTNSLRLRKNTVHALLCGLSFILSQKNSFWYDLSSITVSSLLIGVAFLVREGFFHKVFILLRDTKQKILSMPFFSNTTIQYNSPTKGSATQPKYAFEATSQNPQVIIPNTTSAFTLVEKSRKRTMNSTDSLETLSQPQIHVDIPEPSSSQKENPSQSPLSLALRLVIVFSLLLYIRLDYTNTQSTQTRNTLISTSPHLVRMIDFSENPQFLTVLIPTVPRPKKQRHLMYTLQGLLDQWPEDESDFFYNKLSIRVYSPPDNPVFDEAKELFSSDKKGSHYIHWEQILTPIPKKPLSDSQEPIKEGSSEAKEKKALQEINSRARNRRMMKHRMEMLGDALLTNSSYIMLLEDDFVLCENGWNSMLFTIDSIMNELPNHCGVFVATGGSGLIFTYYSTPLVIEALLFANESTPDIPSDIVMQKCVRGTPETICGQCKDNLGVSSEMIFKHIGGNSSTVENMYVDDEWQCGWRQVFNGEEDIYVIDIR